MKAISRLLFRLKDSRDKDKPVELKHYLHHQFDTSESARVSCNMLKPGELLAWNIKNTSL